jgi:hypothetical protein
MMFLRLPRAARAALCVLLISALCACAPMPPKQAYNREANQMIKRIDVLPMRRAEVGLDIFNHPGYSFGLIGLAIAEADMAPKRNWVEAEVKQLQFDGAGIFRDRFNQAMTAKGYQLIWSAPAVEDPAKAAPRGDWGYRKHYFADAHADAQLDVSINYVGFAAAGAGSSAPYHPTVAVAAKLVSPDGKAVLMADQIAYNAVFPKTQAITINADPAYTYPEFTTLRAAGSKAFDGLRAALESAADELARQY